MIYLGALYSKKNLFQSSSFYVESNVEFNKSQERHFLLCLPQAGEVESESQASSRGNSGKNNDVVTWSEREKTIGDATKSEFLHPISKFPIVNGSFINSTDQGVTYFKMFISKI